MLSKKLFILMIVSAICSFTTQAQASYERLKNIALAMPIVLTGPCITASSLTKLKVARNLKKIHKAATIAGAETRILSLQKRGCIGLAIGTILSTPIFIGLKSAYDEDKAWQETEKEKDAILSEDV